MDGNWKLVKVLSKVTYVRYTVKTLFLAAYKEKVMTIDEFLVIIFSNMPVAEIINAASVLIWLSGMR
jgi:hypothetical protein